jgi:hypothetical protein
VCDRRKHVFVSLFDVLVVVARRLVMAACMCFLPIVLLLFQWIR